MSSTQVRPAEDFYIYRFDRDVYTLEYERSGVVAYFSTMAQAELRGRAMAHRAGVRLWRVKGSRGVTLVATFRSQ